MWLPGCGTSPDGPSGGVPLWDTGPGECSPLPGHKGRSYIITQSNLDCLAVVTLL